MSKNKKIEDYINEYYDKKDNSLTYDLLREIIEEVMLKEAATINPKAPKEAQAPSRNIHKQLPEFPDIGGGSSGEFAEGYVCYGIRLGGPDQKRFGTEDGYISFEDTAKADEFGAISQGGRGWKPEKYYMCVKIGQAISRDKNSSKPDPGASQSGDGSFKQLDGKKGTSKTDLVIFGKKNQHEGSCWSA